MYSCGQKVKIDKNGEKPSLDPRKIVKIAKMAIFAIFSAYLYRVFGKMSKNDENDHFLTTFEVKMAHFLTFWRKVTALAP